MLKTQRILLFLIVIGTSSAFADVVISDNARQAPSVLHRAMPAQQTDNMLFLLEMMRSNITQMSDLMESHRDMNKTHLTQAAQVMQSMSDNMQQMSQRMQRGQFDDKSITVMNINNQHMINMMQQLESQLDTGRQ